MNKKSVNNLLIIIIMKKKIVTKIRKTKAKRSNKIVYLNMRYFPKLYQKVKAFYFWDKLWN